MKAAMKPSILVMALLATAACGCESEKKPTAETPEYEIWRRSRISKPAAHYAPKVSASLEVFPASHESSTSLGFGSLTTWVRGYLRADIALGRADHLVRLHGITPAP